MKPLRVAALVKQIPKFEAMSLGADGRLKRDGVELSMNPYCQRALSKGIELAQVTGGQCTVISLGPPGGGGRDSLGGSCRGGRGHSGFRS